MRTVSATQLLSRLTWIHGMQALQQQMSKAAGLAADRSAALGSLEGAKMELAASHEAAAGLKLELTGSQAEAARLR